MLYMSRGQRIAAWIFGVALPPVLFLIERWMDLFFNPSSRWFHILFMSPDGQSIVYAGTAIGVAAMAAFLLFEDRLGKIAAPFLLFGSLFALSIGLVLLLFSAIGLALYGLGLLGFIPFATAWVYFKAWRQACHRSTRRTAALIAHIGIVASMTLLMVASYRFVGFQRDFRLRELHAIDAHDLVSCAAAKVDLDTARIIGCDRSIYREDSYERVKPTQTADADVDIVLEKFEYVVRDPKTGEELTRTGRACISISRKRIITVGSDIAVFDLKSRGEISRAPMSIGHSVFYDRLSFDVWEDRILWLQTGSSDPYPVDIYEVFFDGRAVLLRRNSVDAAAFRASDGRRLLLEVRQGNRLVLSELRDVQATISDFIRSLVQ